MSPDFRREYFIVAMDIDSSGVEHPTADVIPTCSPMIDSDDGDEESMSDDDPIDVDDLLEESYRMRDERDSLAAPSAAVNGCPSSGSADAPAELSHKYKYVCVSLQLFFPVYYSLVDI